MPVDDLVFQTAELGEPALSSRYNPGPVLHRMMALPASLVVICVLSGLYGVCRAVSEFLRLFLRQGSGSALVPALFSNLELGRVLLAAMGWALAGAALAVGLSLLGARLSKHTLDDVLRRLVPAYSALLLPVCLTLLSVLSLMLSPSYPYGFNLALSLTLEGAFASLVVLGLFLAGVAASLGPVIHLPTHPSALLQVPWRRVFPVAAVSLAMGLFVLATPQRFYQDGVGQGNMFKYLRMAAAVAGSGSLDIGRADANPDPTFSEFLGRLPGIGRAYVRRSVELAGEVLDSLARGELYFGEVTATRANRSMFRSAAGGIYYINAPGPGLVLVPAYLLDRAVNRWLGTERQLVVVLFWNLLAALLVYEIVLAAEAYAGRPAATLTAFAMAASVPFLFYTFQIYPELPGGLLLLHGFRKLVLDRAPGALDVLTGALALAALPWLHQKYSLAAAVMATMAGLRLLRRIPGGVQHHPAKLALLAVPLAISAYSVFLYNHALTGSLAPTATFEAAGRSSFEPRNFLKGFLGLLVDRENGLFVFAPLYLLALVGAPALFHRDRRIASALAVVLASYLVVIASFPYWPGAVSTMGRYVLSMLPLVALPMALVARRALVDGWLAGVALALLAGSLAFTVSFTGDLIPSYQPTLLWDRALYSDPAQYLPSFLSEGIVGSGPAHEAKLLMLLVVIGTLIYLLRDRIPATPRSMGSVSDRFGLEASSAATALVIVIVLAGGALEHWPGNASQVSKPRFREALNLSGGRTLFVFGEHGFEGPGVWVPGGGATRFVLSTPVPHSELTLLLTTGASANTVVIRERGQHPLELELPPDGPHQRTVLLREPYRFEGRSGERYLYDFVVRSRGGFIPAEEGEGDDRRRLGVYVRIR